jgi:hypothetical protein
MLPLRLAPAALAVSLAAGCVTDPTVEDQTVSSTGVQQPGGDGGATIDAAAACGQLVAADKAARARLGCEDPKVPLACPDYVRLVGAMSCSRYLQGSVTACVTAMAAYQACGDFDTRPCVATVVRESCRVSIQVDSGSEASVPGDSGARPDAAEADASDASAASGAEAGRDAASKD